MLSPLIMFTCTVFCHALLEWQKTKVVHPKASMSKLRGDRPDRSNYFNNKTAGGKNTSCSTATGRKLFTLPGIANTHTFLMNTWNTLLESYKQRVYKNPLDTVKHQIQQAENPMPAMVISIEAPHVDKAILLDYLTSKVALEELEIGSTNPNISIVNDGTDDKLHCGTPGQGKVYEDEGDKCDQRDPIPTTSLRQWATTELKRFDLGTSDVDRYEGGDGDDADADEEEESSQADDASTQNIEG